MSPSPTADAGSEAPAAIVGTSDAVATASTRKVGKRVFSARVHGHPGRCATALHRRRNKMSYFRFRRKQPGYALLDYVVGVRHALMLA
jgi:hypothetical protein